MFLLAFPNTGIQGLSVAYSFGLDHRPTLLVNK